MPSAAPVLRPVGEDQQADGGVSVGQGALEARGMGGSRETSTGQGQEEGEKEGFGCMVCPGEGGCQEELADRRDSIPEGTKRLR